MFEPILHGYKKDTAEFKLTSALDVLEEKSDVLNCEFLQEHGGIPCGQISEFCGLPGSGKTQLCMYLSLIVQLPKEFNGLEGECVYVDTSANFSTCRLKEMHSKISQTLNLKSDSFGLQSVLKKIHFMEILGTEQLCAVIELLPDFILKNGNIRLVIIDSIGYSFKDGCPELERTGILYRILNDLQILAKNHNIAILITNEMSTRLGIGAVPGLGDAYSHRVGKRFYLISNMIAMTHSNSLPYTQISWSGIEEL